MNIRLFGIYSVPIRISSPELHVPDTYFLDEINIMGRYVTTTYRLHNYPWILSEYVSTTYPKYKLVSTYCNKCLSRKNYSSWVNLSVSTVLIPVWWTWDVLCWGDRLTTGFADVLQHSPFSGKDIPISNFVFILRGGGGGDGLDNRYIRLGSSSDSKVWSRGEVQYTSRGSSDEKKVLSSVDV